MKVKELNTTALAFIGDAVYETYIRKHVIGKGYGAADRMHKLSIRYVRAESQAKIMKEILPTLTDEEKSLVRRAKNRKSATKPKNVDIITYKWATAFEALIGDLFLKEEIEKMENLIGTAIEIVER